MSSELSSPEKLQHTSPVLYPLHQSLPPEEAGFLNDHLARTDNLEIEDVRRSVHVIPGKHGPAFVDEYDMNNGFYYEVITAIPDNPRTTLPVDMTTAWGTSAKVKSHNGRSLGLFVEARFPARLFGPPKIRLPKHTFARLSAVPKAFALASQVDMDKDIAAYALIANDLDRVHSEHILAPGVSIRYGESRGIMEGLGSTAVDKLYGRKTIWLEGHDPCVPDELKVQDLLGNPKTIGELFASMTTFRHLLTEARRLKYIDTFDPSFDYLIPGIMTYRTLFSGRAGEYAQNIPPDTLGHINFFNSSVANGYQSFQQKLAHAPEVHLHLLKGGHLTLAAREMVYRSIARMLETRKEFERHGSNTANYDLERIHSAQPKHLPKIKDIERLIAA